MPLINTNSFHEDWIGVFISDLVLQILAYVSVMTGAVDWIWTGNKVIGDYYYLSQYPNNVGIVYLLAVIAKSVVAGGFEIYHYYDLS